MFVLMKRRYYRVIKGLSNNKKTNRFVLQEMGKIVEVCLTCEELMGVT